MKIHLVSLFLGLLLTNSFSQQSVFAGSHFVDATPDQQAIGIVTGILGATELDPDEDIFAQIEVWITPQPASGPARRQPQTISFYHEDKLCAVIRIPGVRPCPHVTLSSLNFKVGDLIAITQKQSFWSQRKTIQWKKL